MSTKRPRDRKDTILAAAADLFAQRGYAAVGIDDIGTAVGITGPAIYRHFPGKDALLMAVMEWSAAHVVDAVKTAADSDRTTPEQVIRAGVSATIDRPTALAASIRERHRLAALEVPAEGLVKLELENVELWRDALGVLHPGIEPVAAGIRLAAVVGLGVATAIGDIDVARPRLDDLGTASCLAVLCTPAAPPTTRARNPSWRPQRSRRDEILAVAARLFRDRGFHDVGVSEIGEAAGIAGPTIYRYYESKVDILVEAWDQVEQRVFVGVEQALEDATSAADALERLVRSYANVAIDNVDLIAIWLREADALPAHVRPRFHRRVRAIEDRWVAVLGEVRSDLSEPELRLFVRAAFPMSYLAIVGARRNPERIDDVVAVTLAHLNSGFTTDAAST